MFSSQPGDLVSFSVPLLPPMVTSTGHYGNPCPLKTGSADSMANADTIFLTDTFDKTTINRVM